MNALAAFSVMFVASSVTCADIAHNDQLRYGNFVKMEGFVLRGEAMVKTNQPGTSDASCAFACIKTLGCDSYNYGPQSNTCSLMATDHYKNASVLEALNSHNYYYRASACDSSPCQNKGTCFPLFSQKSMKCLCPLDFAGNFCETLCSRSALGMASGAIADNQLSMSSYDDNKPIFGAGRGRLNTPDWPHGALFLKGDSNQWFQVDLLQQKYVTGLATQGYGYPTADAWVSTYQISWSNDGTWTLYQDDQQRPKTFNGNTDNQGIVKNEFKTPIRARWIKILTKTCNVNQCSFRLEFYGCSI